MINAELIRKITIKYLRKWAINKKLSREQISYETNFFCTLIKIRIVVKTVFISHAPSFVDELDKREAGILLDGVLPFL